MQQPPAQPHYQSHRFTDMLKRLLRRDAIPSLKKIMSRTHPADVALVLNAFLPQEKLRLLSYIDENEKRSEVIACLALPQAVDLIQQMPMEQVVAIVSGMSGDDRADILGALDEELAAQILKAMPDEESDEATELMRYEKSTAGGIMSLDYLAIAEDVTAKEAIHIIQNSPDVELVFYIYVVSSHGLLVGVVSLRQLVTSKPDKRLHEIMNPHVVAVRSHEDQEDVARIVSRYDFLAVPVVDDTNKLLGVITVDDIIDVIREEATEDILKLAGAGETLDERQSVSRSVFHRAPWLFAAWLGGVVASIVIGRYEETLQRYLPLASFIPILLGMAGNVGTQSLTIVVRGLATRRISIKDFWTVAGREVLVGCILGLLYGAALGGMGFVQLTANTGLNALMLAAVVATSAAVSMTIAAVVGSVTPLIFARLHIDPAVATGPFVTTTIDVLGVLVYFNMANILL